MESFIIGGITSLILGIFIFLFQKSKTKLQAQIKIGLLIAFELIILFGFIGSFFMEGTLILVTMLTSVGLGIFVAVKIYHAYLQIKNNNFPNDKES